MIEREYGIGPTMIAIALVRRMTRGGCVFGGCRLFHARVMCELQDVGTVRGRRTARGRYRYLVFLERHQWHRICFTFSAERQCLSLFFAT